MAKNPFAGRHPMTSTTRALPDATKGNPRRLKRVLAELQDLWDSSARDIGIVDVFQSLGIRDAAAARLGASHVAVGRCGPGSIGSRTGHPYRRLPATHRAMVS